jgi:hypothetical protein
VVDELLHFPPFTEQIHGSSRMKIYPSPKQFMHRIIRLKMEIGSWKMIMTIHTDTILIFEQALSAGIAYLGKNHGKEIV